MLLAEQELYTYMCIRFYILHACYMHVYMHSKGCSFCHAGLHRSFNSQANWICYTVGWRVTAAFLERKQLETASVCYHFPDFFLLGRVAVNWANALKLHIPLIESKNSFFYETSSRIQATWISLKYIQLSATSNLYCVEFVCLLSSIYMKSPIFLLIFHSKGWKLPFKSLLIWQLRGETTWPLSPVLSVV